MPALSELQHVLGTLMQLHIHRRFDNELQQGLKRADVAAGCGKARKQVVVLGSGMDTRPWRHTWLQGGRIKAIPAHEAWLQLLRPASQSTDLPSNGAG